MLHRIREVFTFQMKSISQRIVAIFLLVFLFTLSNMLAIGDFADAMGLRAAPWGFPHLVNDWLCMLVIMAGAAALFCDAPFRSELQIYILPRAGQTAWTLGHMLYILVLSFLFVLMLLIASIIPFLTRLDLQLGWGKIWGTLARSFLGSEYGVQFQISDYLIGVYKPLEATLYSFLLTWVCCVWLGMLTYLVNTLTGNYVGTFLASGFVLMDLTIANEWLPWFYRISPVTMAQLHTLKQTGRSIYGVTPLYAACFFSITILCFMAGTFLTGKRNCINQ